MTIAILKEKGVPNTEIARMLEVTEGAVTLPRRDQSVDIELRPCGIDALAAEARKTP